MVDLRKDKRAPASLKVKYKSASVDEFIDQFGGDVSRGGMFIKTKQPLENGALLKLELQLANASPVIHGVGKVAWRREPGPDASLPAGMGIRFIKLDPASLAIVERIQQGRAGKPSRFEQPKGAQMAPLSEPPPPTFSQAPAPPAKPAPGPAAVRPASSLPRPAGLPPSAGPLGVGRTSTAAFPGAPVPKPAIAQRPTGPVAGLFADSPMARQRAAEPAAEPPSRRSSFFPPGPAAAAARSSTPPSRHSGQFLATALAEGGAREDTAKQARALADAEGDLVEKLFDEVTSESPLPPRASAAARVSSVPAPAGPSSVPPPAPRSSIPVSASEAADVEDMFAELSLEEGLGGRQSAQRASAPGSRASAAGPATPARTSAPLFAKTPAEPDEYEEEDDERDTGEHAWGEADIFANVSLSPPAAMTAQAADAPVTTSVAPLPGAALQQFEAKGKSSAAVWIALGLLAAVGAGGYFYYQQQLAAKTTSEPVTKTAPAQAPQPGSTAGAAAPSAATPTPGAQLEGPSVEVEVTSVPRGADISVDGKPAGMAPSRVSMPSGREVRVQAASPGYATMTKVITPTPNTEPLRFKLEPLPYFLLVRTDPAEAELSVGPRTAIAPGPLELGHLEGSVLVSVVKAGYQRMTRPVRLEEFTDKDGVMRAEIEVRLSPLPGTRPEPAPAPIEPPPKPRPKRSGRSKAPAPADSPTASEPGAPAAAPEAPAAAPAPAAPAPGAAAPAPAPKTAPIPEAP